MSPPPAPWDPWADLARRSHLRLVWVERGRRGCLDFGTREISLRRAMPRHETRCVVAHELVHDERGAVPRWLAPREEAAVRDEAARRLIAVDDLARALQWSPHLPEVAEELDVDLPTLRARLRGLTDAERARLPVALARPDECARAIPGVYDPGEHPRTTYPSEHP